MKNIIKKFNFSFSAPVVASALLVSLTALTVFATGPGATPPSGNVDASFNSVTTTTTGVFGTDMTANGNATVKGNADVQGLIQNTSAANALNLSDADGVKLNKILVDGNSNIQNSDGGIPVTFNDDDGVVSTSTTTTAIRGETSSPAGFSGVQGLGQSIGVSGIANGPSGIGGSFSGTNAGVNGAATGADGIGVNGVGTGSGSGIYGSNADITGSGGIFSGGHGITATGIGASGVGGDLRGDQYGVLALSSSPTGIGGEFYGNKYAADFQNPLSGKTVQLGTSAYSIVANSTSDLQGTVTNSRTGAGGGEFRIADNDGVLLGGTGAANSLFIDQIGALSNTTAANGGYVAVNDAQGLAIQNAGVTNLAIAANGDISNSAVGAVPVKVKDDQGLQVSNSLGTTGVNISGTGLISNLTGAQLPIGGGLLIQNAGVNNLSIAANGDISNPNAASVTITDHLKATGGIGGFNRSQGFTGIAAGGTGLASVACAAGQYALSCGYSDQTVPNNAFSVFYAYVDNATQSCRVFAKNNSAGAHILSAELICFNPNI